MAFPSYKYRLTILFLLGVFQGYYSSEALVVSHNANNNLFTPTTTTQNARLVSSSLFMSDNKNDGDRLRALGYSEDEIRRSSKESQREETTVRVDIVDGVDAATLTAVGFGLIALNFFVFANMGDGGIAGVVASIINTMNN